MISDHKTVSKWKIQLTLQISFISHKDSEETRTMYTKSYNIELWRATKQMKLLKNVLNLLQNYQKKLRRTNERKRVCS